MLYDLRIYANDELLDEIRRNLPKVLKNGTEQSFVFLMNSIVDATMVVETLDIFSLSPDPKDNFLFDIAQQTGNGAIITNEKRLLTFQQSPVPIYDLKWFKENYPVPE